MVRTAAPLRVRSASLALAALALAEVRAQQTDCATAEAQLAARGTPVCSPRTALSPAQELACAEYDRWLSIATDCRRSATRDDRRWLERFANEVAHRKAEAGELEAVVVKLRVPNARLAELLAQHKVLREKAEFYPRGLPPDLLREVRANDASLLAVRDVFRVLELEIAGIVDKYADERTHLRKLWGGAAPGTIGLFVPRSATTSSAIVPPAAASRT
ncbi:MAG: hypothetical protein JO090_12330 [Rhizobacter sp.]|nr:hypothetical protein [Rhizobacter sp.]